MASSSISKGATTTASRPLKSAARHVKPDLQEKICLHIVDMLAAKAYAAKGMYGMAVKRLKSNMTADIPIYSLYNSYKALSAFYAKMGAADSSEAYRVKYLLINDTTLSYSDYMRIRDYECRFLPARVMGELDTSGASGISGGGQLEAAALFLLLRSPFFMTSSRFFFACRCIHDTATAGGSFADGAAPAASIIRSIMCFGTGLGLYLRILRRVGIGWWVDWGGFS